MQVIKDKLIIEDSWTHITDEAPLQTGDITVTQQRWLTEKDQLLNHDGKIGLRLTSTDSLIEISDDLARFALIELNFAAFTDGRSFSMAKLLKHRYHFNGEIRATGNFLRDQLGYLSSVGFDSFKLTNNANLEEAINAFSELSVQYQ